MAQRTFVGTSVRSKEAPRQVVGRGHFVDDMTMPRMLHAFIVRSPYGHARIVSVDATAALALPGVHLVMTADDLPQPVPRFGPQFDDRPVLAVGETKYHGEPVALVVADTRELAEQAAALVRVEHEILPAVFTIAAALAADAPLVQDPAIRRAFCDPGEVLLAWIVAGTPTRSVHAKRADDVARALTNWRG